MLETRNRLAAALAKAMKIQLSRWVRNEYSGPNENKWGNTRAYLSSGNSMLTEPKIRRVGRNQAHRRLDGCGARLRLYQILIPLTLENRKATTRF